MIDFKNINDFNNRSFLKQNFPLVEKFFTTSNITIFQSIRILINLPLTYRSLVLINFLSYLKAELFIIIDNNLVHQKEVLEKLSSLNVKIIDYHASKDFIFDLAIDYQCNLTKSIKCKFGIVNTNSNDANIHIQNYDYPSINLDLLSIYKVAKVLNTNYFCYNFVKVNDQKFSKKLIIILGYNLTAQNLALKLLSLNFHVIIAENDQSSIKNAISNGFEAYESNDTKFQQLVDKCDCLILTSNDPDNFFDNFDLKQLEQKYFINLSFKQISQKINVGQDFNNNFSLDLNCLMSSDEEAAEYYDLTTYSELKALTSLITKSFNQDQLNLLDLQLLLDWQNTYRNSKNLYEKIINSLPIAINWYDNITQTRGSNNQFKIFQTQQDNNNVEESDYNFTLNNSRELNLSSKKIPLCGNNKTIIGELEIYQNDTESTNAEEQLKQALEEKTNILNNMSHEVRAPIHGICGASELLDKNWENLTDKQRKEQIHSLANNSQKLKSFIDNILDISKFSAGRMVFDPKNIDLITVINETINYSLILYSMNEKVKIDFNHDNIPQAFAYVDEFRINQLLINLLSNAIKYGDGKAIKVKLAKTISENTDYWQISITDQGIGIPPHQVDHIFEAFIQSNRTKNTLKGTGLGLALAKEIVTASHGKIWAENNKIKGATFHFILPKVEIIQESTEKVLEKATFNRSIKILFIDDEEFCHNIIKLNLSHQPVEIFSAYNGEQALEIANQLDDIDIIMLDIMLPDINGSDLYKKLRTLLTAKGQFFSTIFQSGMFEGLKLLQTQYADDDISILSKPYSKDEMIKAIQYALSQVDAHKKID